MLSGYTDPYAGYYNADGTAYSYDPNAYTAPEASAAPTDATAAAAPVSSARPSATNANPADIPASATADQAATGAPDTAGLSAEQAANLLSVDEKVDLEQQQEAADHARKDAEERFQKAEEQRRNAKVLYMQHSIKLKPAHSYFLAVAACRDCKSCAAVEMTSEKARPSCAIWQAKGYALLG